MAAGSDEIMEAFAAVAAAYSKDCRDDLLGVFIRSGAKNAFLSEDDWIMLTHQLEQIARERGYYVCPTQINRIS